jgi:iron complex outermembrane recepter protein
MHFTPTLVHRAALLALGWPLLTVPSITVAQTAPDPAASQRIEVTGSRIKRVDAETASPVQVLTREDIERTGKQSVQEVLRGITADGLGSIPSSFSAGFASGSAAVSLRGLGVNSTLVLVNGRRMTTYGLADDGTRNFVDLNSLPLEAIDRIEVLKDGASAVYGADAVGGVVNVILRENYTGASIGASAGAAGKSDGQTLRWVGSAGFGDLKTDRYNLFFTAEASTEKNIWAKDRGFIGQSDLTRFGYYDTTNGAGRPYFSLGPTSNSPYGVVRDPVTDARVNLIACDSTLRDAATGLCRYNPLVESEVQPAIDRLNLFGRATLQFSPNLTAYTELGIFKTRTRSNGGLGANNDSGVFVPGDLNNPLLAHGAMNLPAAHPDNPFDVDRALFIRPAELGGRDQQTDNEVIRLVAGVQGSAFDWDYDIGAAFIKSRLKNQNFGFIRYDVMQAALNDGSYRIGNPNLSDPAVLAAISPTLVNRPTSSIKSIDIKASRELIRLPGGALGLAVGAEARQEAANTPPVPFTDTAQIVGLGFSAFSAKRSVRALFAEIDAPLTPWLDVNAALRYDKYSDVGDATTPKIGFKIKPIEQLGIRGTYSEAFRAPGPAESGGSSFGFTTFGILSQGNPDIQPETAKSFTLGVIAEPRPGTSATVDFWKIDRRNEIVQADPNTIIGDLPTTGAPNTRIPGAEPGTFIYYDAEGNLGTVTGFYRNAAKTSTDGVDIELRQRVDMGAAGKLAGQLNWTHVSTFRRTDVQGNTFDYAGTHGPLVQSAGGGSPKDRATLTLTWDRGPWALTGALNYVGPIRMVDHQGEVTGPKLDANGNLVPGFIHNDNTGVDYPDNGSGRYDCGVFDTSGAVYNDCKLPSFTTVDVFARWSATKALELNVSIQNLFDRKAPFDPYLAIPYATNYNNTWHQAGAVGRFLTVGAKYTFN